MCARTAAAPPPSSICGETDLLTVHQIHSTDVLAVGQRALDLAGAPKADALVTDRPGVALGVLAADCAPVLFADAEAQVIGAAHAGWKGALGGVVDTTIAAMEKLGARRERVRAAIGPCIGAASYEVGPEFPAPFLAQDKANDAFFRPAKRAGHFMFDLAGYLLQRLALGRRGGKRHRPRHAGGDRRFLQLSPQHAERRARLRPRPVGRGPQRMTCPT